MTHKYVCTPCSFKSNGKSDYTRHCKTKKHEKNDSKKESVNSKKESVDSKKESNKRIYACEYCNKKLNKSCNLSRHYKSCANKLIYEKEKILLSEKEELEQLLTKTKRKLEKQYSKKQEIERKYANLNESKLEIESNYHTLLKTLSETHINNINHGTVNNTTKIKHMYNIINNYTNALNFDECISTPITSEEYMQLQDLTPVNMYTKFIENRCINDIEEDKRPIHCTDVSRKKYTYFNNGWNEDTNAEYISEKAKQNLNTHLSNEAKNTIDSNKKIAICKKIMDINDNKTHNKVYTRIGNKCKNLAVNRSTNTPLIENSDPDDRISETENIDENHSSSSSWSEHNKKMSYKLYKIQHNKHKIEKYYSNSDSDSDGEFNNVVNYNSV